MGNPREKMGKVLDRLRQIIFKPDFQKTVVKALRQWVAGMPPIDRESKCVFISRASYSPREILTAVEHQTDLGIEFVSGLSELQERMMAKNPKASVADLIRRSSTTSTSEAKAGAASA
jgi:hypothetical protein